MATKSGKTHAELGLAQGDTYNPYSVYHGAWIPSWLLCRSNKEVSIGAKMAYARLVQYCGKNGKAFPRIATLAREIGYGYRHTQRLLDELEKLKLIRVVSHKTEHRASDYEFLVHPWASEGESDVPMPEDISEDDPDFVVPTVCMSGVTRPTGRKANDSQVVPLKNKEEESNQRSPGASYAHSDVSPASPSRYPDLTERGKNKGGPKAEVAGPKRGVPKGLESEARIPSTKSQALPSRSTSVRTKDPVASGSSEQSETVDPDFEKRRERAKEKANESAQKTVDASRVKEQKRANLKGSPKPPNFTESVDLAERVWSDHMAVAYPKMKRGAWDKKQQGQIWTLIRQYGIELTLMAIEYWITQFASISKRIMRGTSKVPSLGLLCGLHETIFAEAQMNIEVSRAKRAIDAWLKANPGSLLIPDELTECYEAAIRNGGQAS